ncbi:MAG: cupin domain-containing protein [Aestuariibacter sp.]
MKINADFEQRVVIHSEEMPWLPSPMPGVERRPLDRIGEEVARATSIVKYAPGSEFSPHVHTGGEEFIVLEGVFQDEHGDFPAGSYIRNPPQSRHKPGSAEGCIIFVKLWQFDLADRHHVRQHTDLMVTIPHREVAGISVQELHQDSFETVTMQKWQPNAHYQNILPGGAEILVLQGELTVQGDRLKKHSWMRLPVNAAFSGQAGPDGARIWLKEGHLTQVERDIKNLQQYAL